MEIEKHDDVMKIASVTECFNVENCLMSCVILSNLCDSQNDEWPFGHVLHQRKSM